MIDVRIRNKEIWMHGHAGHFINGQDIVCSAISALTCSLVNSLRDLANEEIAAQMDSGMTVIKWQRLTDKGKLLLDSWYLALQDINQEYHCIRFI